MFRIFLAAAFLYAAPAHTAEMCERILFTASDGRFEVYIFDNGPSTLLTEIVNGYAKTCDAPPTATGYAVTCDGLDMFQINYTNTGDLDYDGLVLRKLCAN